MARPRNTRPGDGSMLARATAQAGDGASLLFARLDAEGSRGERAAEVLIRLAGRLRAGEWNSELADLVTRANALDVARADGK